MSARVIKNGASAGISNYALFALPGVAGTASALVERSVAPLALAPAQLPSREDSSTTDSLEALRAEGESLIASAKNKASEIEREARERGTTLALAAIEEEVARMVEPLREQLAQSIVEIAGLRASVAARAERDLVRLALEIAKKIVHREVEVDSEIALTLVRVALSRIHNRGTATVRLHPDDFAYVNARRERLDSACAIEIVEDRSVGRGGCLVQTEMGDIDARIEQQFAEIERSFLSA